MGLSDYHFKTSNNSRLIKPIKDLLNGKVKLTL